METNDYAGILDSNPSLAKDLQEPDDQYGAILAEERAIKKQNLQESVYVASQTEPDQKAKVLALSKQTNLPPEIVARNFDEVSKKQQINQFGDYNEIIDKNPRLATWLQDPDNATLGKDDLDSLKGVESSLKTQSFAGELWSAFQSGSFKTAASISKAPALTVGTDYDNAPYGVFNDTYSQGENAKARAAMTVPESLYKNSVTQYLDQKAAEYAPKDQSASFITEAWEKGDLKTAGRALSFQIASNLPQLFVLAATRGAGLGLMGLSSAADKYAQNLESGIPADKARSNALVTGLIEAGTESLGGIGGNPIKEVIKDMGSTIGATATKDLLKRTLKDLLVTSAEEGAEEYFTSLAQDMTDYGMDVNPNALDGLFTRANDSFFVGAGSGFVTKGSMDSGRMAIESFAERQAAKASKDAYTEVGDKSVDSKLRKRSPEKYQEYVASITEGTPMENIYLPIDDMESYFQSKSIDPAQFAQELGVLESYNQAKETGADVKVPYSVWTAKTIDTEHYQGLADDIKFAPEAASVNQKVREDQEAKAEVERTVKEAKLSEQAAQDKQRAESRKQIFDDIKEKLVGAGRSTSEANALAQIYASYYESRAERRGMSENPLELFNRVGLEFNQVDESGQKNFMGRMLDVAKNAMGLAQPQAQEQTFDQSTNDRPFQETVPYPSTVKSVDVSSEPLSVDQAKGLFNENVSGKTFTNDHTGWDIDVSSKGKKKATKTLGSEANRLAFANMDKLLKNAIYARTEENRHGLDAASDGIKATHVLYAPFSANGKDYIASIKVNETNGGKKFYDKYTLENETPRVDAQNAVDAGVTPSTGDIPSQTGSTLDSGKTGTSIESNVGIDHFIQNVKNLQAGDPFFQGAEDNAPRGRIRFKPGVMASIELFQHADSSTVIHESGHLWFNELIDDATSEGVPEQLKRDLDTMLAWVGAEVRSTDGADSIRSTITVEQHEQMARGFEAYLMEGKAPSPSLRKVFAKFKVWLIDIYKNIANLRVPLNDDVRSAFGRMLVADNQTTQVEADQSYKPLYADPLASGMGEDRAARYTEAVQQAKDATEERIRKTLLDDLRRQDEAFYKEKRKAVSSEVRDELMNSRAYQALYYLQKGTMPDGSPLAEGLSAVKISKESLAAYGEEVVNDMPRGITAKDGMPLEIVAEVLNYGSASELVDALRGIKTLKEAVASTTESRMAELYPDSLVDGTISEEAVQAYHNDNRAKVLRMEFEELTKNIPALKDGIRQISKRVPSEKAVREQATKIVADTKVQEIKPYVFQRAEIKAAKEAGTLFTKGDFAGAAEAKRKELLNHELYRVAVEANDRVEKDVKNFKKMFKADADVAKTRDVDMVNAARAVLAEFGITRSEKTAAEYLQTMQAYDPDTYQNMMTLVESATEKVGPYKTIPFDDFVAMSDTVSAIWDLAKSSREMDVDGMKIDRNEITSEIQGKLEALTSGEIKPGVERAITEQEKKAMGIWSLTNLVRRVEHWAHAMDAGDINGSFTKFIVRPILEGATKYRLKKADIISQLRDIVQDIKVDNPNQVIAAPEIGYNFKKSELIMALLHTGNESNLQKLLLGREWGSLNADKSLNTSNWDKFIARAQSTGLINQSDMNTVQKIWDLNESIKPDAQKAHKKMYGYYFNEITSRPVQTPWGEYRGGYMPAIADHYISLDANIRAGQDIQETPSQMFPTTGRGFTKSRVDNFTTPLSLDFGKIPSHIDKVLKFTYIEPAVKDVSRLINDRTLRKSMNAYDNDLANDFLLPWLKRAATQKSTTPGFNKTMDKGLSWFRRTSAVQFMVLNFPNFIQNFTGAFPALTRVDAGDLAGAFKRHIFNPNENAATIMELSPYMKSRAGTNTSDLMRDIDEVILKPSKIDNLRDSAINNGYVLERLSNGIMEFAVWGAAHDKAVRDGLNPQDSINQADATVRQTQSAMNPEDIARYESSSPFVKLFTMFSGFFNTQANLMTSEMSKAKQVGFGTKEGAGKAAAAYGFTVMAPAVATALIMRVMSGAGLDEDRDGEYWDDFMDIFFMSQAKMGMAMIPGGGVVNSFVNAFNSKPYDDKINLSPAFSVLEKTFKAPVSIYKALHGQGSQSEAIKNAMTALGLTTGLPATPLGKPLGYISDVKAGKAHPLSGIDYARGLVTGRSGQ